MGPRWYALIAPKSHFLTSSQLWNSILIDSSTKDYTNTSRLTHSSFVHLTLDHESVSGSNLRITKPHFSSFDWCSDFLGLGWIRRRTSSHRMNGQPEMERSLWRRSIRFRIWLCMLRHVSFLFFAPQGLITSFNREGFGYIWTHQVERDSCLSLFRTIHLFLLLIPKMLVFISKCR